MSIILNDNIRVNAGKPSEPKYLNTSNVGYANTAEVLSQIPIAQRHEGLTVKVGSSLYWFRDGVADIDLIPFAVGSSYTFTNGLIESGGVVKLGDVLSENTTIGLNGFTFTIGDLNTSLSINPTGGNFTTDNGNGLIIGNDFSKLSAGSGFYNVHLDVANARTEIFAIGGNYRYLTGANPLDVNANLITTLRTQQYKDADGIFQLENYLGKKELSTDALNPSLLNDGQVVYYNSTTGKYELKTITSGLTNALNGLTNNAGVVELGGSLTKNTNITGAFQLNFGTVASKLTSINNRTTGANTQTVYGTETVTRTLNEDGLFINSTNGAVFELDFTNNVFGAQLLGNNFFGLGGGNYEVFDSLSNVLWGSAYSQFTLDVNGDYETGVIRLGIQEPTKGVIGFVYDSTVDADLMNVHGHYLEYDANARTIEDGLTGNTASNWIPSYGRIATDFVSASALSGYAKLDGSNTPFTGAITILDNAANEMNSTNGYWKFSHLRGIGSLTAGSGLFVGNSNTDYVNMSAVTYLSLNGGVVIANGTIQNNYFRGNVANGDMRLQMLMEDSATGGMLITGRHTDGSAKYIYISTRDSDPYNAHFKKAIIVGDSSPTVAGSIRYNTNKHQFYNGSAWHYSFGIGQKELDTTAANPSGANDGQVYYYDNATGKVGLKTVSGGSSAGSISNYPITMSGTGVNLSGNCYASLVVADKTVTITSLNTFVKFNSASTVYLGVYSADGNTLLTSASASTNAIGFASGACSSVTLTAGVSYWFAVLEGVGACTFAQTPAASDAAISKSKFVSGSPTGMPANLSGFAGSTYNIYCAAKS